MLFEYREHRTVVDPWLFPHIVFVGDIFASQKCPPAGPLLRTLHQRTIADVPVFWFNHRGFRIRPETKTMKTKNLRHLATAALLPLALLAITSCSSSAPKTADVQKSTQVFTEPGVPGGKMVQTYKSSVTVTAIDADKRELSVVSPNGAKATFKCGPRVINFDQIKVGDQIHATVTRELVVALCEPGDPEPADGGAVMVALPEQGEKPGAVMVGTKEVTATLQSMDETEREATLLFPDGSTQTYSVRPDIDMTKVKLGQQVTIRTTDSIAVLVEDP